MTPGRYPIRVYRGDSYTWRCVIWLDTQRTRPFDLTGVTAKAEIREQPGGLRVFPLDCQVTLPNTIDVVLSAFASRDLPETGVWDLQLTTSVNQVGTILRGDVTVVADVTDSHTVNQPAQGTMMAFPKRGMGVRVA